ncbi:glycosyltransferase [Parabacteroides goldsteinii]|nr:glycosyltransferase [Parabacteroides goldsteinii]MDZ3930059.1 glycosyltransferase [Parabacteroides goldsteinii]
MDIKISVIIPIYNRTYCLARCLDSVLFQTFTDWECILIDDGSTDGSLSVCRHYAETDSRFRVYSQSNSGASVARNRGWNWPGDNTLHLSTAMIGWKGLICNYYMMQSAKIQCRFADRMNLTAREYEARRCR